MYRKRSTVSKHMINVLSVKCLQYIMKEYTVFPICLVWILSATRDNGAPGETLGMH